MKRGRRWASATSPRRSTSCRGERVLDSVNRVRRVDPTGTGQEASASSLLEDFGFTGDRLTTRIGELSGGERRRLQLLRMLLAEPNVLLLDEPTNDLDIDTLTVVEDYLDSWPGTLIVVSHDRYFLERVCDVTYALLGDGRCVLLPGGVEQYLAVRRAAEDRRRPRPAARRRRRRTRPPRPVRPARIWPGSNPSWPRWRPDRPAARPDGRRPRATTPGCRLQAELAQRRQSDWRTPGWPPPSTLDRRETAARVPSVGAPCDELRAQLTYVGAMESSATGRPAR